jgi:hypothetical protein
MMNLFHPLPVWAFPCTYLALLAWCPAASAQGDVADRLQKLERNLSDLKKEVDQLKEGLEAHGKQLETIEKLPAQVSRLSNDVAQLHADVAKQLTIQDIETLRAELAKLLTALPKEKDLEGLREGISKVLAELARQVERRQAFSLPTGAPAVATGQVHLVNAWMTPMTVILDGLSYRLQPGESRIVSRAAGNFNYEVLGLQPPQTRTVVAGETFTIRIAPR